MAAHPPRPSRGQVGSSACRARTHGPPRPTFVGDVTEHVLQTRGRRAWEVSRCSRALTPQRSSRWQCLPTGLGVLTRRVHRAKEFWGVVSKLASPGDLGEQSCMASVPRGSDLAPSLWDRGPLGRQARRGPPALCTHGSRQLGRLRGHFLTDVTASTCKSPHNAGHFTGSGGLHRVSKQPALSRLRPRTLLHSGTFCAKVGRVGAESAGTWEAPLGWGLQPPAPTLDVLGWARASPWNSLPVALGRLGKQGQHPAASRLRKNLHHHIPCFQDRIMGPRGASSVAGKAAQRGYHEGMEAPPHAVEPCSALDLAVSTAGDARAAPEATGATVSGLKMSKEREKFGGSAKATRPTRQQVTRHHAAGVRTRP